MRDRCGPIYTNGGRPGSIALPVDVQPAGRVRGGMGQGPEANRLCPGELSRRDHERVTRRDGYSLAPSGARPAGRVPARGRYVFRMTPPAAILLVEDDPDLAALLRLHLEDLGLRCDHSADGADGLALALAGPYALVVLDVMLPTLGGLEVCRRLRAAGRSTPVLMLTARGEEVDKVLGLELGADDYVTKPFALREVLARVRALLRRAELNRTEGAAVQPVTVGALRIEPDKRRALLDGVPVELTAKEFDLLALFASHPGRVFPRTELLERVWGYTHEGYNHTVNSHINRLRAKIESDPARPRYVRTVWGVGYRFAEPAELAAEPPALP